MDSFTLTISHLQSPIFYLATVAAGSNLRPPFSIFDLTSGADGWALGSTICILHLLHILCYPKARLHNALYVGSTTTLGFPLRPT